MWRVQRSPFKLMVFLAFAVFGFADWYINPNPETQIRSRSSTITISEDGDFLWVANPDSNSVSRVDLKNGNAVAEIAVGVDPRAVAAGNGRVFVANQGSDTVSMIDPQMLAVTATLKVDARPVGVALSPDENVLAVAELGADSVRLIDAANLETTALIVVADRPHGLAFTPDGQRLLVSHLLSGQVTVIPLSSDDPFTIATWANVAPAPAVIANADGTRAYLPQTMAHGLGLNTQFDNSVFPKVSVLDLSAAEHLSAEHISLPEADQPVGLPWDAALSYSGDEIWVVNSASNDVSVIDIRTPDRPARVAHIPVGHNPRGIVFFPDGTRAYVHNALSGTVSVINAQTYTVIDEITVTTLPLPPILLNGKRLFYSSARDDLARAAWISCNTCHIEGEHDGRTWLLQYLGDVPPGEQPVIRRNTNSLLGMVETYPLRWSAEWDESADSEFSVR